MTNREASQREISTLQQYIPIESLCPPAGYKQVQAGAECPPISVSQAETYKRGRKVHSV